VVSEPLPTLVAERRAKALREMGLDLDLRVLFSTPSRALVSYGIFASPAEAQSVAQHVRTIGYTARVVTP